MASGRGGERAFWGKSSNWSSIESLLLILRKWESSIREEGVLVVRHGLGERTKAEETKNSSQSNLIKK